MLKNISIVNSIANRNEKKCAMKIYIKNSNYIILNAIRILGNLILILYAKMKQEIIVEKEGCSAQDNLRF